ncbi:predicted protein [Uncinocarpus reesii 1704]|uniref:Kelch repeat protein n=1 Tax=Uncinocarpus reesii (strain UAMH 1704) TaxID=336963 RepID=C4JIT9_UNCRE|nr:uncharacterized protein UREG_02950 [Uncinocarpus reesii 1704]EEP78101.1 predicted protein [Uncinocarpus reesii 1704]
MPFLPPLTSVLSLYVAGVIRDTIYLDGGELWWRRGLTDGTYDGVDKDASVEGQVFTLPLSTPFDTAHTNLTGLFGRMNAINGASASLTPNYVDGAMLANDYEFILYGGLHRQTDNPPPEDQTLSYERYYSGQAGSPNWKEGFVLTHTNNNVTRYITHGAGVSVPSENRGYYFSGMRGENWGPIAIAGPLANDSANSLVSVDMSKWRDEEWDKSTLPPDIIPRGKAELAWVPVSDSGVLIAIGGVPYPEDVFKGGSLTANQTRDNERLGDSFMKTVSIYDIASKKWFTQNTTGIAPPGRSDFCSVVASAKNGSSHNIYIYGGYGGSDRSEKAFDDVYILSVPSFTWIKASQGQSEHGRRGHKCVKVYPNQMFVLGGEFLGKSICLNGGVIQVYNLNTLSFQNVYDPETWEEYKVPSLVVDEIRNADGGATVNDDLRAIFSRTYSKPIKTYYPYRATETPSEPEPSGGGGLPNWVGPVLGVVLGLILITGLVVAWLLWRRRKDRRYAPSEGATSEKRSRIMGWIYGTSMPGKNIDATTTATTTDHGPPEKHMSAGYSEVGNESVTTPHSRPTIVYSDLNEAASSPVHELQASSRPALGMQPLHADSADRSRNVFSGATIATPLELPTEYNESPISPRPRFPSDAGSFISPVSPEPGPVSPPASPPPQLLSSRPTHNRHNSSLSSMGFPTSMNNAATGEHHDNTDRVINEEENLQRNHFVSGITEDFSSDSESNHGGEPEVKTW